MSLPKFAGHYERDPFRQPRHLASNHHNALPAAAKIIAILIVGFGIAAASAYLGFNQELLERAGINHLDVK